MRGPRDRTLDSASARVRQGCVRSDAPRVALCREAHRRPRDRDLRGASRGWLPDRAAYISIRGPSVGRFGCSSALDVAWVAYLLADRHDRSRARRASALESPATR